MCVHVCIFMIAFQLFYVGARGSDIFPVYKSATIDFEYSVEEKIVVRKER